MTEQQNSANVASNTNSNDFITKLKQSNPGIKVKKVKGGGVQIVNPRAPSTLLNSLIKKL